MEMWVDEVHGMVMDSGGITYRKPGVTFLQICSDLCVRSYEYWVFQKEFGKCAIVFKTVFAGNI